MKNVIKLIGLTVIVLTVLIGYRSVFGDDSQKKQSKEIIGQTKNLLKNVTGVVKEETGKFDKNKFLNITDKLGDVLKNISKSRSSDEISTLKSELNDLKNKIKESDNVTTESEKESLKNQLNLLINKIQKNS